MASYVVTGGAGFIGTNIVEELIKRGQEVKVIDDLSTGKRSNLKDFMSDITFVKGSIMNYSLLKKEFQGFDYVLHQAADVSVQSSVKNPSGTAKTNVLGTINVLKAAKDAGVKRVVLASSCAVYGEYPTAVNENTPLKPLSPYAVTKSSAESFAKLYNELYGLETVCLRYFNVFGPRQDDKADYSAVIPKFIKIIKGRRRPTIFGDGFQSRDFVYVSNVVEACLLACTKQGVSGKIYNIGTGISTDLNSLVKHLNKILEKSMEPKYEEQRAGDIMNSKANIGLARKELGYFPKVDMVGGLRRTVEFNK
ncbi:MAG: NAD-dependent epimerase/dehydratase family protein [Candidatus Undinarchaeales archaeon]|jgi:UDP-glucose 4-epimerase|nr:NAD-dependent epimerase/dehydratase family protein [Candidatus Undinarchaeales archaeon]